MKVVIGIILVILIMAGLVLYLLFMLNSHSLVFCGGIPQSKNGDIRITQVYTNDLDANQTLSEIVSTMNSAENGSISSEDLTNILATYQNIIYAPVFTFDLTQEDSRTFVLEGSVYNGLNEADEPTSPDFIYRDLALTAGVSNGKVLAAQNIYPDEIDSDGQPEFKERSRVVDPVLLDGNAGAAFAFRDCDSFRIVFTAEENLPASITLAYTYQVVAENPLDFTRFENGTLGVTITAEYDELGQLIPTAKMERVIITQ